MRQRLRAFGLLAIAVVAITCTDAPTSPDALKPTGVVAGHVQMTPTFSPEAARAYAALSAFGVTVTEIHIVLTGPDGSVRDTVIAFPVGQDSIAVDIPVPISGTDQPFSALIELRNDQHVVLFSGRQVVFARAFGLPRLTAPLVLIQYTGPGKSTKTVTVGPPDTTVSGPVSVALRATGVDNTNVPVTDLLVAWTVSDATLASVTSTGNAAATLTSLGKRGIATITAATPLGITGTTRMTFVPAAARIVVISGNSQTGVAGTTLAQPLVVEVQAADNLPVPGVTVTFSAVTAGGSVQQATVVADGTGRASTTMTLGTTAGAYQYRAASGALASVTVTETATPAPPALLVIESGNNQIDSIGRTLALPLVVKVTDQYGGLVKDAIVKWSKVAGLGTLGVPTSLSGVNGLASNSYTLGNLAGFDTVRATVSGIPSADSTVLFSMRAISRAPASILIVSGGGQSGSPTDVLPTALVARVADAQNNPVSNVTVTWSSSGAAFAPVSSATDANGLASTIVTLGGTPGTVTVTATGGGFATNTTLTINGSTPPPPSPTMTIAAGNQQTTQAGTNVPVAPSVLVRDGSNNPVANAAVVFSVASGGGSVTGGTTTTNAQGIATVGSWTLGATPGANTLTATSGSLSATFTATGVSAGPTHFAFVVAPPAQFVVGGSPVPISARLLDAQGNPVLQAGVAVTFTGVVSPGPNFATATVNTDASGTASIVVPTYNGSVGTVVISVTSPGLTSLVTSPIPIVAGSASAIIVATQPATSASSGTAFSPQPAVQLVDAGGNPVSTSGLAVVATIATGGGTLSGTTTVNTDATGKAAYTDLVITGTAGSRTLRFTAGSFTVQSNAINVTSIATSLNLNGWTVTGSTGAGDPFATQPTVQLTDANNLPVAAAGVVVTASIASGPTTPTPIVLSATATTNANGQAIFSGLGIGGAVGTYTLSFSAPSITSSTSNPLTIVAGTPASIAINSGQSQTAAVATEVAIPPSVKVVDAYNNPVAGVGVTFTASGTSQVSNGTTTATSLGATTNSTGITSLSWILGTTPGAYTLTVSSGTLTGSPLTFNATATAGPPATLVFVTPPSASASSGVPLPKQPVIQLKDAQGNDIATGGVVVTASITSGSGTLTNATATTTPAGTATFSGLTISGTPGNFTLQFAAPSFTSLSFGPIALGAGAPSALVITAQPAAGTSGTVLSPQPVIQLQDASGNPVSRAGVPISAALSTTAGTLSGTTTVNTNAGGQAVFTDLVITGPSGGYSLVFNSTGLPSVTGVVIDLGNATATKIALLTTMPASITVGASFPGPIQVQLLDANNNPVPQSGVLISANGLVQPSNTTYTTNAFTNSSGIATFTLAPYVGKIGTLVFTMTAPNIAPLPTPAINVLAGSPAMLVIVTQPPSTASSGAPFVPQPTVQVTDAGQNPVNASTTVVASIQSGSGTLGGTLSVPTNANGLASFTNLSLSGAPGPFVLLFSATSLQSAPSTRIDLGAGGPANIIVVAGDLQSAVAGTNVAIAPSVRVTDGAGNPLQGISVTFTPTQGGGAVTGGTAVTNASGVATVGSWQLGITAGPNSLDAAAGSLHAVFTATATAGSATKLGFGTSTPATASSGIALSPQPSVQLLDANGNPVLTSGVVVTATVASGIGTVTGATATTSGGLATFSGLTITGTAGSFTLQFSATGVTPLVSPTIALGAGTASALLITTQPGPSVQSGSLLSPQPVIQLIDGAGNPVAQAGVGITAQIQTGGGSLTGTLLVNTIASGQAAFTDLVLSGIAGNRTLRFTSSVGGVNSANIAVSSAPVTQLVVTLGNNQVGSILTTLPQQIVVEARDANNFIVPGILLSIAPQAANATRNGTPSVSSATTNGSGQVSFTWKLSRLSKPDTVVVATPGNTVTRLVFATATPAPFSQLVYADQPGNGGAVLGGVTMPPLHIFASDSGGLDTIPVITPVTLSIRNGTGTPGAILTGGGPVNTASNGVVTFINLSIDKAGTGYILDATNGTFTGASLPFNVGGGAATSIRFLQQPSTSTGGAAITPTMTVALVDAGGNIVPVNTTSVTLTLVNGTGMPGASLSGRGPITFVNGVASFPAASIDFGGTAYKLLASTTALNAQGAPIPSITSVAFDIIPGPAQLLRTKSGRRINVSPVGAANPPAGSRPVFIARNAQGNVAPNLTINLVATGRCRLDVGGNLVTSQSLVTDSFGEVTPLVRLPSGADGAGCLVTASGPSFTTSVDSSQLAVFPTGTSHVWFGAVSSVWTNAANWVPVTSVPSVPSSPSDVVFIPDYNAGIPVFPLVSGPKPSMNRLAMDTAAVVQLNGIGIDIGSGGVTGFGVTLGGSIHIQATAPVGGVFDVLDIGQSGSCGSAGPMTGLLKVVSANVLNVRCKTNIDTTVVTATTLNVFPNNGQGWLHLTSNRAALSVSNGNFTGDSLWVVGGAIFVNGSATFGGGVFWNGGTYGSSGTTSFASNHALYNSVQMQVQGNAIFGGSGAGRQQFAGGLLDLNGNFTQLAGTVPTQTGQTFVTSSDHATNFNGSAQQDVSFATPTTSTFSVFRVQNTSVNGVHLLTDGQLINGTTQPRVDLVQGKLQINSGRAFTLNRGSMRLGFNTNLNLIGDIVNASSCSGRTTNSATITGGGNFNGAPVTATTCTP